MRDQFLGGFDDEMGLFLRRRTRRRQRGDDAISWAARAPISPKWPRWACRCPRASPSPRKSAPTSTPTARPIRPNSRAKSTPRWRASGARPERTFGDAANPLLVSVRSGARASMPGMMDTVLNLGLNDQSVLTLAKTSGDERFAYDSYRRFIQMYSNVVLEVDHHNFEEILEDFKDRKGHDARHRPFRRRLARDHRRLQGEGRRGDRQAVPARPERPTVGRDRRGVLLVDEPARDHLPPPQRHSRRLGHRGQRPGDGVRQYGRDLGDRRRLHPQSLDRRARSSTANFSSTPRARTSWRAFARRRTSPRPRARPPAPIKPSLEALMPEVFRQFVATTQLLEKHYRDMQDLEFTVERGKLWMLQTRNGKRTARAALAHRGRNGERRPDLARGRDHARRSSRARPIAASDDRSPGQARAARGRPAGLAGRRERRDRVLRRRGGGVARAPAARRSWCAWRPRPRTSTACTPPRASSRRAAA